MSPTVKLTLRGIARDWHAGELRVLTAALVVAVASMTAVGFFTDRVERAMSSQAAELLAADIVVRSPQPIQINVSERAARLGLNTAHTLSFRSVLLSGEKMELAEVKAVSQGYPLRGQLRIAQSAFETGATTTSVPSPGAVWLDSRLTSQLELDIGDTIELGESTLVVESVLSYEPDRGGDMFNIAPRLMMHIDDVEASNLVQAGSRVTHSLLVSGPANGVEQFKQQSEGKLTENERFLSVREGRPELRTAIDRAEQFLGLAALIAVLLSGAAIAVSSRRYVDRRLDMTAIMRCMGASQRVIMTVFCGQVLAIGLGASLIGCGIGFIAQSVLVDVFSVLLVGDLPISSYEPIVIGLLTGTITLAGFALPPLLRLRDVSPARVIRRDLGTLPPRAWTAYGFALLAFGSLVMWHARDARLAAYVLGSTVVTLVILGVFAALLVRSMRGLTSSVGTAWRFGLANLSRRARDSVLQIVAFGLGFTMLLLLTIVRGDILDEWRTNLPADAPNYFLINVQPDDVEGLTRYLESEGIDAPALYPMVRARLRTINAKEVDAASYETPRARRLATRQFNLSWSAELNPGNRITAGEWWQENTLDGELFSVEEGLAATLGMELGDTITFDVAGQTVSGQISNLRTVEWDSFNVNFFVVSPPALLQRYPATFISSFHLPSDNRSTLVGLVRQFPSVTVLDVDALLSKVRQIMDQAVLGVEYVFMFTIVAGVVVLIAAVQSTMDERRFETAIIRTLGGRKTLIWRGLLAEFVTLGLIAGALAALIATGVGMVVAKQIFQLDYQIDPQLWIIGLVAGGLGTGLAGLVSARGAIAQSPLTTLRAL